MRAVFAVLLLSTFQSGPAVAGTVTSAQKLIRNLQSCLVDSDKPQNCSTQYFSKQLTPYEREVYGLIFKKPFQISAIRVCQGRKPQEDLYCFALVDDQKDRRRGTISLVKEDGTLKIRSAQVK